MPSLGAIGGPRPGDGAEEAKALANLAQTACWSGDTDAVTEAAVSGRELLDLVPNPVELVKIRSAESVGRAIAGDRAAAVEAVAHPEWGSVTSVTSAFYDPYVLRGQQAFDSYVSSWVDSGVNQLSVLARFVELTGLVSGIQTDGGASAWYTAAYTSPEILSGATVDGLRFFDFRGCRNLHGEHGRS